MSNKKGLLALSPLFLLIVLIVAFTVYSVDSSHQDASLSLTVAFMISSIYAVAISGGMPVWNAWTHTARVPAPTT